MQGRCAQRVGIFHNLCCALPPSNFPTVCNTHIGKMHCVLFAVSVVGCVFGIACCFLWLCVVFFCCACLCLCCLCCVLCCAALACSVVSVCVQEWRHLFHRDLLFNDVFLFLWLTQQFPLPAVLSQQCFFLKHFPSSAFFSRSVAIFKVRCNLTMVLRFR